MLDDNTEEELQSLAATVLGNLAKIARTKSSEATN